MQTTSFLLGVLLIAGAYEVSHATSDSSPSAQRVLDTLNMPDCSPLDIRLTCLKRKHRTFDGTCNNLCNTTRGAADTPLTRLPELEPTGLTDYAAGFEPREAVGGGELPNCRVLSRKIFRGTGPNSSVFTHITMTWGQFVDHDLTLTEMTPNVQCGVNRAPCPDTPGCIGITIPDIGGIDKLRLEVDPLADCIPLRRSNQPNNDGQQVNEITHYLDGSQVYGSDLETAWSLRDPNKPAFLDSEIFTPDYSGLEILPEAEAEAFCTSPDRVNKPCFRAGDIRVNENQALMAMHTLWVREHNRIAKVLHDINPKWDQERLFQETRKIVIAELQHITYNEWLEVLFGETLRANKGVALAGPGEFFNGYDPAADASIVNSFSTAAFRFGHSLIQDAFSVRLDNRNIAALINVSDFFNPAPLFDVLGPEVNPYGGIFHGLAIDRAQRFDHFFSIAVWEFLRLESEPETPDVPVHGDLPAINCARTRDHGLPGYVNFRLAVGLDQNLLTGTDLSVLTGLRSGQTTLMQPLYQNVGDVGLFEGAVSERPQQDSELGPTMTFIILRQFQNLRKGDRFWYENNDPCTGFTLPQLTEIRKSSLARVICDNADHVTRIQAKVFRRINAQTNPRVNCAGLPHMDLSVFKEEAPVSDPSAAEGANTSA